MQKNCKGKALLTIVTVNYNTAEFIAVMLYAFEKLTVNQFKVIICDNGSRKKEILKLVEVVQLYDNVDIIFRKQSSFGSIGHAEAMDILVSKVDTEYFVTMDSDAIFLQKDWDKTILGQLNNSAKVIGTALPPTETNIRPVDFPSVFAVLYDTETYKKFSPSFLPGDNRKLQDTGWEIRDAYLKHNVEGIVFESKNTRFSKDTVFKELICATYYLDNELIASHFGRGSSNGAAKYRIKWFQKIPFISRLIRQYIGKKEKENWIHICYKIIEDEVS